MIWVQWSSSRQYSENGLFITPAGGAPHHARRIALSPLGGHPGSLGIALMGLYWSVERLGWLG